MSDDKPKLQKKRSTETSKGKAPKRPRRLASLQKTSSSPQRRPSLAGRRRPSQPTRQRSKARPPAKEDLAAPALSATASFGAQKSSKRPRLSQAGLQRAAEKTRGIDLSWLGIHDRDKEAERHHIVRVWLISAVVVVGALIFLAGCSWLVTWQIRKYRTNQRTGCKVPGCSDYAAIMSGAIDESNKPCDNYYQHVCGIELKRLKEGATMITRIRLASFEKESTGMVAMKVPAKKQSPLEKAAAYMQACLAVTNRTNVDEVRAALRKGGITWPDPVDVLKTSFVDGIVYMSAKLYTTVLLTVKLIASSDGNAAPSLSFGLDSSFLGVLRMLTKQRLTKRVLGHFQLTYASFASSPEMADNKTRFNELFNDIIEVGMYFKNTTDYEKSLNDSSKITVDPRQIPTVAPSTDYETWNTAFVRHFNVSLDNIKSALITYPKYFTTLFQAHAKFGATKILNMFGWLSIQSLIHYTSGKMLASYYFSSEEQALTAHRKSCLINTYGAFRYAINVDQWQNVPAETLQYVLLMADDLWEALQKLLAEPHSTLAGSRKPPSKDAFVKAILRHKSLSRPESMTAFYASMPDMTKKPLSNYVAVRQAMAGRSTDPQFYDMSQARDIELSERLRGYAVVPRQLHYPWLVPGGPYAVALAGLGLRMAATLYFQSVARLPNPNATHATNFRCLAPDSKDEGGAGEDVPAAAAAVRIIWRAWKTASSRSKDLAVDLGPVPRDAVLFAFHCWFSCGPHPYNEMLCNVPLKHSPDFAQLYGCASGSGMNPGKKCSISM